MDERLRLTLHIEPSADDNQPPLVEYVSVRANVTPRRLIAALQEKLGLIGSLEVFRQEDSQLLRDDLGLDQQNVMNRDGLRIRIRKSMSRLPMVVAGLSSGIDEAIYLEDVRRHRYYPIPYLPAVIGRRAPVGRGNQCQKLLAVDLPDVHVSRCHACLFEDNGNYYIQNLKNETDDFKPVYVNNAAITARNGIAQIRLGTTIKIGQTILVFNIGKAPGL